MQHLGSRQRLQVSGRRMLRRLENSGWTTQSIRRYDGLKIRRVAWSVIIVTGRCPSRCSLTIHNERAGRSLRADTLRPEEEIQAIFS
jgi:hypothetical protein